MWTYHQKTGRLENANGKLVTVAYSGHGEGLNNHDMEAVRGVGPIPVGRYRLARWEQYHPHLGPTVAALIPVGHDAHDRSGFYTHGDNPRANHTASDGCIIVTHDPRVMWMESKDLDLEVVAE